MEKNQSNKLTSTEDERQVFLAEAIAGALLADGIAATGEANPLLQQIASAEKTEEEQLLLSKKILGTMQRAAARQKNVATDIKAGMAKLEELLDSIRASRESCRRAAGQIIKQTRQKATPKPRKRVRVSTPTPSPDEKRASGTSAGGSDVNTTRVQSGTNSDQTAGLGGASPSFSVVTKRKGKRSASAGAQVVLAKEVTSQLGGKTCEAKEEKKKKKKNRNRRRPKRSALVVKPSEGKTYAEILGAIRSKVRPGDTNTVIRAARKTKEGGLLLELEQCSDQAALHKSIQEAVGQSGEARILTNRMRLEALGMDCLTTAAEVEEAVRRELGDHPCGDLKVAVFPPNNRELRMAVIDLEEKPGRILLERGKISVGWVRCRIRQRAEVQRCYRCLGYGHQRQGCKGPDRSGLCWKCGQQGHKATACSNKPRCYLCTAGSDGQPLEHVPGSGACKAFRAALEKVKERKK